MMSEQERLEAIEQLARSYWEQEGRPEGRHVEHWLRAEQALAEAEGEEPQQEG